MAVQVRARVLALAGGSMLVVALAAYAVLGAVHERSARAATMASLRSAARLVALAERQELEKLAGIADALAADEELRRIFERRDRAALLRAAGPIFDRLKARGDVTHWYFIAPDRTCFLRVHAPQVHGDVVNRLTLSLAERSGDLGSGKELGLTAFALRVVRAWRAPDGTLLGYLEVAEDIDPFLLRLKEKTGDELALAVKKSHLDEKTWRAAERGARDTWNDRPDVVVVDTTTFTEGLVDYQGDEELVPDQGVLLDERSRQGHAYARGAFPLRDAVGRPVGATFLLHDVTDMRAAFAVGRLRGLFVVLGVAIVVGIAFAVAIERFVFRRRAEDATEPEAPPRHGAAIG